MLNQLTEAIAGMNEPEALKLAKELLEGGQDPLQVLEACRLAMEAVGKRYEEGSYFLPELIMAGEMLAQISELAKPLLLAEGGGPTKGRVLIATVEGDIHDLGKNIVTFMLETNGYEVLDLGVDVPVYKVVEAVTEFKPQVVGLSGLLILAFEAMKATVDSIEEAGLRRDLKIMVGGGQMNEEARAYIGADAFGADAVEAVHLADQWVGEA